MARAGKFCPDHGNGYDDCSFLHAPPPSHPIGLRLVEDVDEALDWLTRVHDADPSSRRLNIVRRALADANARLAAIEALTWDPATHDAISGRTTPPTRKVHVRVRNLDPILQGRTTPTRDQEAADVTTPDERLDDEEAT